MKILLLLLVLLPTIITAAILNVALDGSQPYLAIQTAVNAAAQNDTILVYPGTYFTNVEINQKSLTLASLEMTTGDSTYISQTVINGNQTGSCIRIISCDSVVVRGLYLTNGNGSPLSTGILRVGGGILSKYSKIRIINNRIILNNNVHSGAGCYFYNNVTFMSGTIIAYNHGTSTGGIFYGGYPTEYGTNITFDPINRCSIYLNTGTWGNDICLGNAADTVHIYLDYFTVPYSEDDIGEFIYSQINTEVSPYTFSYNNPAIIPQYADFYVSPTGNDTNSGLSSDQPLKTIALALIKVKADSLHPQTIHLANGVYSNSLNEQAFPLNLRSYVTIQGESESGAILDGDNIYGAFGGYNSEVEVKIRSLTLQHFSMPPSTGYAIIWCISRYYDSNGILRLLSMELENISIMECHPNYPDKRFSLIEIINPMKLIMRNIQIDNCTGANAITLGGSNIIGENISIRNFHYAPGNVNTGQALLITQNNITYGNRPNVFTNLEITNCHNNQTEWSSSAAISITSNYGYTSENTFINATIADNVCSPNIGCAVLIASYTNVNFINSIISNNYPYNIKFNISNLPEPCRLRLMNNLLYACPTGNGSIYNSNPDNVLEYYGNNLDTMPDFNANYLLYPYSLNQTSPCIDTGTNDFSLFTLPPDFVFPFLDLAGNPRVYGTQVDMGAYEWNGTSNQDEMTEVSLDKIMLCTYPNPVYLNSAKGGYTFIEFTLPEKTKEQPVIDIYNLKGQKVRTIRLSQSYNDLVRKAELTKQHGSHSFTPTDNIGRGPRTAQGRQDGRGEFYSTVWDCKDDRSQRLASGIYIVKVTSGIHQKSMKMTLLK